MLDGDDYDGGGSGSVASVAAAGAAGSKPRIMLFNELLYFPS